MNLAAITHQARTPMCCALDQETLQITLRTGRDADAVELIYADPYEGGIAGGEAAWQGRRAPMSHPPPALPPSALLLRGASGGGVLVLL